MSRLGNRWVVVTAGPLVNFMVGINLSWSVFVIPLMDAFGWTKMVATLPFTIYIIATSLVGIPAGRAQDRIGPRKVGIIGSIIFGCGFTLAALIGVMKNPLWLCLIFAPIAGMGGGIAYAATIPPARKWFPDKPAMALGLVVTGLGLSALLFAPLERYLIDTRGLAITFLIIGIIILVVSVFGSTLLRNPPEGWTPETRSQRRTGARVSASLIKRDCQPGEVLKSPRFYALWVMFAFTSAAGLMVIGHIAPYSQEAGLSPMAAATAAGVLAVFNGLGRPGSGLLADKIGVLKTMLLLFAIQGVMMLVFPHLARGLVTIYVLVSIIGFLFGSIFTVFPSITADFFGLRNLGVNYGLVFTAFGAGATLGPVTASYFYDTMHSYVVAFTIAAALTFIAVVLTIVLIFVPEKVRTREGAVPSEYKVDR